MPTRHDYFEFIRIVREHIPQTHEMIHLGDIPGTETIVDGDGIERNMGIDLIRPKNPDVSKKKVLVVAGFHGEEIAGPWGLAKFLVSGGLARHSGVDVSLIPVVNPDGFHRAQRYNRWHEVSNHGFFPEDGMQPSREGKILLEHFNDLLPLSRDGFLTCHENADPAFSGYYFYMLNDGSDESLKRELIESARKRLPIQPSGKHHNQYEGKFEIKDGVVYNPQHDGSFENYMQSKGIPLCITNETPIKGTDLKERVMVTMDAIDTFLSHVEHKKIVTAGDWVGNFLSPTAQQDGPFKFDRQNAWGYCTAMDLFNCTPANIRDEGYIHKYVDDLCRMIGSKMIGPPQITKFGSPDKVGYSFTQLVSTSSITGHFIEPDNSAYIDVFFCNIYDPNRVVALTKATFGAQEIHVKTFTRGPLKK